MTILWCGGEDIDFPNGALPNVVTTAGRFRSGYARQAIYAPYAAFSKSTVFPTGEVTDCWFHAWGYDQASSVNPCLMFGLGKSGTSSYLMIGLGSADHKLAIFKTGDVKLAEEDGTSWTTGVLRQVDMHLESYGINGTVNVYIDGASSPVVSYNGDVSSVGIDGFDCVFIRSETNTYPYMSEIIVADEDTRAMNLITHYPTGDGTTHEWDGSYSDIDENVITDTDVVYTNVSGEEQQVVLSDLPASDCSILAVKAAIRCAKSSTSTCGTVKLGVVSGGTTDVDAGHSPTTSWQTFERLMLINPVTDALWESAEIDALQLALESDT